MLTHPPECFTPNEERWDTADRHSLLNSSSIALDFLVRGKGEVLEDGRWRLPRRWGASPTVTKSWQRSVQFSSRPKLNWTDSYQFSLRVQRTIKEIVKLNCYLNRSYQLTDSLLRKSKIWRQRPASVEHKISIYFSQTTCYRDCRNGHKGAGSGDVNSWSQQTAGQPEGYPPAWAAKMLFGNPKPISQHQKLPLSL